MTKIIIFDVFVIDNGIICHYIRCINTGCDDRWPSTFSFLPKPARSRLRAIYVAGEDKAYATFRKLRWPATKGAPVCPHCGGLDHYEISTRRRFKCAACGKQFSVTSGTILASRKMSFTDLVAAICIIANAAKGISALQLARDLDCQHKTAFVLAHKIREALAAETKGALLFGEVEIDGAYFGGYIRPANFAEKRIDRRLAEHQTGKRRVVVAFRQRKGRTLTRVVKHESDGVDIAKQIVAHSAVIHADEASHWDALNAGWQVGRINHSEAYSDGKSCTNQAEDHIFLACGAWCKASIILCRRNICTSMPRTRHGLKITGGSTMVRSHTALLGWRSITKLVGTGKDIGNVPHRVGLPPIVEIVVDHPLFSGPVLITASVHHDKYFPEFFARSPV